MIIPPLGGFKRLLHAENLLETLWEQINQHCTKNGIMVAKGSHQYYGCRRHRSQQCRPKKNKQGHNTQAIEAAWSVKTASVGRRKTTAGFKRDTIYKWIERKGMPAHKVGRLWKFSKGEIDQWVISGSTEESGKEHD